MKTSEFHYDLPSEYIAQVPIEPRDSARLLVLERQTGDMRHIVFREIGAYLRPGDLLVLNQTRVIPARLAAAKIPTGGKVEILLLRPTGELTWEALVGGKGLTTGRKLALAGDLQAEIVAEYEGPRRLVQFTAPIEPHLAQLGSVPLPPYIHTKLADPERYQTVYAAQPGSAAAPTAGLHFTPRLIEKLKAGGILFAAVTLHVGLDTFAPVTEARPEEHLIHREWCQMTAGAAAAVNQARQQGGRIIAVGTTTVRTLESAARAAAPGQAVGEFQGQTDLFILPGYKFRAVDAMITNFHLPESTLIMLVSAFAGREQTLRAYEAAKQQQYRFYSFGDAMFIH